MQATSAIQQRDDRLALVLTGAGVTVAIILFLLVVSRMGLLGDFGRGNTARAHRLISW